MSEILHGRGLSRQRHEPPTGRRTLSRVAVLSTVAIAALAAPAFAKPAVNGAYPPNVYFHFTDGHGNDFRVPQAVPGLTECNQAKLAVLAKVVQKHEPVYAGWSYVRAECRAPRRR